MRLIGYIRVSRVAGREGESFIAPDVQRERIEGLTGHKVVGWEEDLDQSGRRDDRPGFQRALEAVERGEADGIAVAKLNRFARSVSGAARALERLEAVGGTLVAADLGSTDTSTPTGRLIRDVLMALAEFESELIRENWSVARDKAIGRGVHICRVPPAGYRRGEDGRLELDPKAGPIVREVFRRRADGESWTGLCAYLDQELPREGGSWTRQTVSSLIARRTYLGEAFQGDLVKRDAHEPLVSRAEWEAAQVTTRRGPTKNGPALLHGVLRCAGCGYPLSRQPDGKRGYQNYRCRVRHGAGVCPEPARISVKRADVFVEATFLAWLEQERITLEATEASTTVAAAVADIEAAEAELAAYRDAQLVSLIGAEAYRAGLAERQRAIEEARLRLEEARRAMPMPVGFHSLPDVWPDLTVAEKNKVLTNSLDAVVVKRADKPGKGSSVADRLRIFWRGQAPADLPRNGGPLRAFAPN